MWALLPTLVIAPNSRCSESPLHRGIEVFRCPLCINRDRRDLNRSFAHVRNASKEQTCGASFN